MSRKVVLFVISSLTGVGGAEQHLFNIVRRLRTSNEYEPAVCCLQTYGSPFLTKMEEMGVHVQKICVDRNFRVYGMTAARSLKPLVSFMREMKVCVVQNFHFAADVYGTIAAKLAGVPVVISSRRDMGYWFGKRHIVAYRIIDHLVDKIIAVSNKLRGTIQSQEHVSVSKIATIYNGVDLERFSGKYNSDGIKRSLGIPLSCPVVGVLGNMRPVKGHRYLLEAMSRILIPDVYLLIIGKDVSTARIESESEKAKLEKLAGELGLSSNIIFTGYRSDIPELVNVMDVAVLPSLSEGFSNALLEYMAMSKPIVATNVGGNAEALLDRQTGLIVPPGDPDALRDAIMTLLDKRKLAEDMGLAARKRLEEVFSLDRMVQEMETLYNLLLATHPTGR